MNIDPEILLGLQNYKQNRSSLELQREILAMQKLQVLNQVRKSQGLAPIAELPPPSFGEMNCTNGGSCPWFESPPHRFFHFPR